MILTVLLRPLRMIHMKDGSEEKNVKSARKEAVRRGTSRVGKETTVNQTQIRLEEKGTRENIVVEGRKGSTPVGRDTYHASSYLALLL